MICEHNFINLPFHAQRHCSESGKSEREIQLEETLSEVLACFRDEDVTVTDETKERWLNVLENRI